MYIPKRYGESKVDRCPFCQKQAFSKNKENVPVCADHKNESLGDLKCACGSALLMLEGKFGVFFNCIKCGNMNLRKALEINHVEAKGSNSKRPMAKNSNENGNKYGYDNYSSKKSYSDDDTDSLEGSYSAKKKDENRNSSKKEITVKSDDPRYFD